MAVAASVRWSSSRGLWAARFHCRSWKCSCPLLNFVGPVQKFQWNVWEEFQDMIWWRIGEGIVFDKLSFPKRWSAGWNGANSYGWGRDVIRWRIARRKKLIRKLVFTSIIFHHTIHIPNATTSAVTPAISVVVSMMYMKRCSECSMRMVNVMTWYWGQYIPSIWLDA